MRVSRTSSPGRPARRRWKGTGTALAALVAGLATAAVVTGSPARADDSSLIVSRINALRQSQGLSQLAVDPGLTSRAQSWADAMAGARAISYDSSFMSSAGTGLLGENVGSSTSAPAAEAGFESSPSHLDNILYGGYSTVGIGVTTVGGATYVVEDFGGSGAPSPGNGMRAPAVGMAARPGGGGYWVVGSDGGVFSFGAAAFYGSTGALHLKAPIVGMAATPDGRGYWLVASDGGVFSFGDAPFFGSTGALHLAAPMVGMAAAPDGRGYWLVASDGGVFSFGAARYLGSAAGRGVRVVGMAADPAAPGYWLLTSGGWVLPYGAAPYLGSAPELSPAVGLASAPDGAGYWVTYADGTMATFGAVPPAENAGALLLDTPVVGVAGSAAGCWTVERAGSVFSFGSPYFGGA